MPDIELHEDVAVNLLLQFVTQQASEVRGIEAARIAAVFETRYPQQRPALADGPH